jgi:hypothetical protein
MKLTCSRFALWVFRMCRDKPQDETKDFSEPRTKFMAKLTDAEIELGLERGRLAAQTEPRANTARYDAGTAKIIIELTNGCTFAFPAHIAQGLEHATEKQLSSIEILGDGYGLHWEELDVDFTVPGLVSGIFGTRKHMARLRAKGTKGGRSKKTS